jgi:hypothetical protein
LVESRSVTNSAHRSARAREFGLHAAMLACVVWAAVGADVISPGPFGRYSGFWKGNDFVQFYVAGSLARAGDFSALVDTDRFRQAQAPFFRAGNSFSFPSVYGPQVALLFSLFARLPYLAAYAAWSGLTLVLTFWSVSACRRRVPAVAGWPWPAAVATAAYPPLGYLVLDGQLSALALTALALGVVAGGTSSRESRIATGAAIGILGYKVSLFAPALAVCVVAGEWRMAGTAAAVAVTQLAITAPIVGVDVVTRFLGNMWSLARSPDLLARNLYLMGSFRTFWADVLPAPWATAAYVVAGGASVVVAAWGWRRTESPVERIGLLALAIVLASPHLFLYDLVILAPGFVASASILMERRATALRWCAWLAFFVPIAAPLAAITHVQLVTIVLAAWLVTLAGAVREETPFARPLNTPAAGAGSGPPSAPPAFASSAAASAPSRKSCL